VQNAVVPPISFATFIALAHTSLQMRKYVVHVGLGQDNAALIQA